VRGSGPPRPPRGAERHFSFVTPCGDFDVLADADRVRSYAEMTQRPDQDSNLGPTP